MKIHICNEHWTCFYYCCKINYLAKTCLLRLSQWNVHALIKQKCLREKKSSAPIIFTKQKIAWLFDCKKIADNHITTLFIRLSVQNRPHLKHCCKNTQRQISLACNSIACYSRQITKRNFNSFQQTRLKFVVVSMKNSMQRFFWYFVSLLSPLRLLLLNIAECRARSMHVPSMFSLGRYDPMRTPCVFLLCSNLRSFVEHSSPRLKAGGGLNNDVFACVP